MRLATSVAALMLVAGIAAAKEVTAEIKVNGMTCGSCAVAVKKALIQIKGVKSADVSLERSSATVVYDDSQVAERQLREAIDQTGFKAEASGNEK